MTHHPRRLAVALLGVMLLAVAYPLLAGEAELLAVGTRAPMFESQDVDGRPFTLSGALEVKPVLLVFWSVFCGTCKDELPILEQELPKYTDKVQFISVNIDDDLPRSRAISAIKGFAKQQNLTFPLLLNKTDDKEFKIYQAYNVKHTPTIFMIRRDGTIVYSHSAALNPDDLAEVIEKAE